MAILPTEARAGRRIYLCAFGGTDGEAESWLGLDAAGRPVVERQVVRDAVSIAAMCELAEETAAGGDLDDLKSRLVALRVTDEPARHRGGRGRGRGAAARPRRRRRSSRRPPGSTRSGRRRASWSCALGGELQGSPFAQAMLSAPAVVEQLTADVEGSYRAPLR